MNINTLMLMGGAFVSPMTNDKPIALIVGICAAALVAVVVLFLTRKKK